MADDDDTQTFDERSGEMFNGPPSQIPDWVGTSQAVPPSLVDAPGVNPQTAPSDPAYKDVLPPEQMARFNRLGEESDQIEAQRRIDARKGIEDYEGSIKDLQGTPKPQLEQSPEAPKAQLGQGLQEYMMVATALAGLAGGFARGNATVALTAFAGAVKGFTQGRLQEFEAKSEEWKDANAKVINDNKTKLDQYDLIFKDKKMTIDAKLSAIKMVAAEHQDEIMYNLAQQKEIVAMGQLQMKQTQLQQDMELKSARLTETLQRIQEHTDNLQANLDNEADRYIDGVAGAGTGFSRNAATRTRFLQAVDRRLQERGMTSQDMIANRQKIAGGTSYQRSGGTYAMRVENAVNEVGQLMPQAHETSMRLPRKRWVPINKLVQDYQAGKSDPRYYDFAAANWSLLKAYGRAMNPSGVPRVSEEAEANAIGILSTATDQKSYDVVLARLWREVQASKRATAQTREAAPIQPNSPDEPLPFQPGAIGNPGGDGWGKLQVK